MANHDPNAGGYRPSVSPPTGSPDIPEYGSTGRVTSRSTTPDPTTSNPSGAGAAVKDAVDQVKQKTGEVVDQAQQQAKSALTDQKGRAAEGLGSVAQAIRQTGQQLREQDEATMVAQYADKVADQIDRFSTQLRERDVDQFINDAQNFARRQPGLFLGGAFAMGVFLARFLKSSSRSGEAMTGYYSGEGYSTPRNYSTSRGYNPAGGYSTASDYPVIVSRASLTDEREDYGTQPESLERR